MKILSNKSFPYPVLGRTDDVTGNYIADIVATSVVDPNGERFYNFKIKHSLSEKVIEALIKSGKAKYCVDIQCGSTIYRNTHNSEEADQEITISANDVSDEVDIQFYIVVTSQILGYNSPNFNKDYSNNSFDLEVGDILAFSNDTKIFWAEKIYQSTKLIKNFFVVRPNPEGEKVGPISIFLAKDKVVIYLSTTDYEKYIKLKKIPFVPKIFHSSLAFPVLNFVLTQIPGLEDGSDYLWFRMLKHKIMRHEDLSKYYDEESDKLDFEDSEIPEISQIILKYPFSNQLIGIQGLLPEVDVDEQFNES